MSGSTIGGIDGSIPLRAGQGVAQPANPLTQMGQYAGVQNALAQNALIRQSTANAQLQNQTGQVGLQQAQQNQATQGSNRIAQQTAGLLSMPQGALTAEAVQNVIQQEVDSGTISPQVAQVHSANIAQAPDEAARRHLLTQYLIGTMAPTQAAGVLGGQNVNIQNGQSIQPSIARDPLLGGGVTPVGQPTQVYPSRAELANRVPVGANPDGSPKFGPAASVTPDNLAGPAASPLGTGRLPDALRNPNAPPRVADGGTVTTGVGPAKAAAFATTGTDSAKAFQDIAAAGVQAQSQTATLSNMLADTSQFPTGPGQDKIKNFQAVMQRFAPGIASAFGIKPDSIAANESFDKFAAQLANAQGAGSDARLAVNQSANPSSHLTPAGVDMILRQLQGNSDYLSARAKLASAYPDQTNRAGFEANTGANLDPRVFQYSRMTPEQKTTFFGSMKDTGPFKKSYKWAADNGLVGGVNGGQ